jgi:CBS domain containing-hemolysin-like protein
MTNFIWAAILLILAIIGVVVRKTYYYLPPHELKRQAEQHHRLASRIYPAVAYGSSLRGLLWVFIVLTSAGGFVLLARNRNAPVWLSLLTVIVVLWAAYSWIPASKTSRVGAKLTMIITPSIIWLLNYLHPPLSRGTELVEKRYSADPHTGLYERGDLMDLIDQQQHQPGSRFSEEELEIAKRALSFGDYKVNEILIPRRQIKTVLADDTIGPILIDEVHKSGEGSVLVKEGKKGPVIGSLAASQLDLSSKGYVRDIMNPTAYYVHENDSLSDVLHAFFLTNHPIFIVVNSFEEYVGIITVENILQHLLGHVPGDDFDQYSNIEAVAARHPRAKKTKKSSAADHKPDETKSNSDETPVKTDDEVIE